MATPSNTSDLDRKTLIALLNASRAINEQDELGKVFEQVTARAMEVLNAEAGSLLLLNDRDELVFETALGPAADMLRGHSMPADKGIVGQALRTGRAVRVNDVEQNRNFFRDIDAQTEMQTRSLMAAPLVHREQKLGVVEVLNPVGGETFSDGDVELLQIFANLVASAMSQAQARHRATSDNRALRAAASRTPIIGESGALKEALRLCEKVAPANSTVLILGETGTGKELVARYVHDLSKRNDRPFVAVNCAALTETLLESELFGHEKGAFTGADQQREGWFEVASGGTLFLDEIGEISPSTQAKLLRVLQERQAVRVGGREPVKCDVRVLAATNRDLKKETEEKKFREDLYYRLSVFPIQLPALRQRIDDVPLLIEHFLKEIAPDLGVEPPKFTAEVAAALVRYAWPGNIRELRNVVERCALLAEGEVMLQDLPPEIAGGARVSEVVLPTDSKLADHERSLIVQALDQTNWNQSAAARELGISRDHLRYRVKKYNLVKPSGDA